jgi:hypothetical protein
MTALIKRKSHAAVWTPKYQIQEDAVSGYTPAITPGSWPRTLLPIAR